MRCGRGALCLAELCDRVEGVLPVEEEVAVEAQMLADLLAARRRRWVHQQRHRAKRLEGVGERLLVGDVVTLGRLRGLAPALVGRPCERVHCRQGVVRVEAVGEALEAEGHLPAGSHDVVVCGECRQVARARALRAVEAAAGQAVEDVREERRLLEGWVDHAWVVPHQDVPAGLPVPVADARVIGLGREGHRPLVEAQAQPVTSQLLGTVVVQEFGGHGRLDGA